MPRGGDPRRCGGASVPQTEKVLAGTTPVGLDFPRKPGCPLPACLPALTEGLPGFGCSGVQPRGPTQSVPNGPHLRFPPLPKTAGSTSSSAWEAASSGTGWALHWGCGPQPQSGHCGRQVSSWSQDMGTLGSNLALQYPRLSHLNIHTFYTIYTMWCCLLC